MWREKRENQRTAAARRPGGINCSAAAASARLRAVQCGRMGVWGVLQPAYEFDDLVRVALLQAREVLIARIARRLEIY